MKEKNNRLFLSVSDEDLHRLDALRGELGMNRSQYIRYIISGQKRLLIPSVKYKELISKLSQIDLSLRVIALRPEMSSEDKLLIYTKLQEIKDYCFRKRPFWSQGPKVKQEVVDGKSNDGRTH